MGIKRASGIGLYLCREICRRLGHRITISSAVDEGTTVRIDLGQDGEGLYRNGLRNMVLQCRRTRSGVAKHGGREI